MNKEGYFICLNKLIMTLQYLGGEGRGLYGTDVEVRLSCRGLLCSRRNPLTSFV